MTISTTDTYYRGSYLPLGACVGYEAGSGTASVARFAFRTGEAGASKLSFRTKACYLAHSYAGEDMALDTRGKVRFILTADESGYEYYSGGAGHPCASVYGGYFSGELAVELLPDTDYYLWLFPNYGYFAVWGVGGCSVTLEGSYGAPSTASVSAGEFGKPLTITLSRSLPAVKHTLSLDCLGRHELLLENSAAYPMVTWQSSLPEYAALMPNAHSATVRLSLLSYLGETLLGETVTEFEMSLPEKLAPELKPGWAKISPLNRGAALGFTSYIAGYSRARAEFDRSLVDFSGLYGATFASFSLEAGTKSYLSPWESEVLHTETELFAVVTDSRGHQSRERFPIDLASGAPPTLSMIYVIRSDPEGKEDEGGNYCALRATANISPINGENSVRLTAAYRPLRGEFGEEIPMTSGETCLIGPVSPDESCELRIRATDRLGGTVTVLRQLPTRRWAMKFRPDGQGVAFGKAPERQLCLELHEAWSIRRGESRVLFDDSILRFEGQLPAASWQAEGELFTQLLAAEGISEQSRPIIDLRQSGADPAYEAAADSQWAKVFMALTEEGGIRFYAREQPETDFEIQGMEVRV